MIDPTHDAFVQRLTRIGEALRLVHVNEGTVLDTLEELDPAVASSRDKGLLIEAVQRALRG